MVDNSFADHAAAQNCVEPAMAVALTNGCHDATKESEGKNIQSTAPCIDMQGAVGVVGN